jgi:hypothetical protein
MLPKLAELLSWAACWIAVTVAILALAAWLTGGPAPWVGVTTFLVVAGTIWLIGRVLLLISALKNARKRR